MLREKEITGKKVESSMMDLHGEPRVSIIDIVTDK